MNCPEYSKCPVHRNASQELLDFFILFFWNFSVFMDFYYEKYMRINLEEDTGG